MIIIIFIIIIIIVIINFIIIAFDFYLLKPAENNWGQALFLMEKCRVDSEGL